MADLASVTLRAMVKSCRTQCHTDAGAAYVNIKGRLASLPCGMFMEHEHMLLFPVCGKYRDMAEEGNTGAS